MASERQLYRDTGKFRLVGDEHYTDYDGQPIEEI
jgi:hypothetical protein